MSAITLLPVVGAAFEMQTTINAEGRCPLYMSGIFTPHSASSSV